MIDLLAIYNCPNCGDVLEDEIFYHEHIDTKNDEIYPAWHCKKCTCQVFPKVVEGVQAFQSVDHTRFLAYTGYFDDL